FGGPIVGAMLMVEGGLGLGAALLPLMLPGFVAAAVGYLVFVGFGGWGGLNAPGLGGPGLPPRTRGHPAGRVGGGAVGVGPAVVIALTRRLAGGIAGRGAERLGMPVLLLAGGLAVGVVAEVADLLGTSSQDVLFSGQSSVPALAADESARVVLVLLVA